MVEDRVKARDKLQEKLQLRLNTLETRKVIIEGIFIMYILIYKRSNNIYIIHY
jgi:hypothetical protein